ncbi:DNA repair protein RAD51 homolog 2-like isoform X2 [Ciona intestinalis]
MLKVFDEILRQELSKNSQISTFSSNLDGLLGGGVKVGSITEIAVERTKHATDMGADTVLSGIYLFRCLKMVQLLAVSYQLFEFVKSHPKVKLVIVDSIAQCMRVEEDMKIRNKLLNNLAANLRKIARLLNVAVVLVNQVTTRFDEYGNSCMVPALGESWSNVPHTKLFLYKHQGLRFALLTKSPTQPRAKVNYVITSNGIRDTAHDVSYDNIMNISQNTTEQLLADDHDETAAPVIKQSLVHEEDIQQQWIELSQKQLVTVDNEPDIVISQSVSSSSNQAIMTSQSIGCSFNKDIMTSQTEDSSTSHDIMTSQQVQQPPSPILSRRKSRKRKRVLDV